MIKKHLSNSHTFFLIVIKAFTATIWWKLWIRCVRNTTMKQWKVWVGYCWMTFVKMPKKFSKVVSNLINSCVAQSKKRSRIEKYCLVQFKLNNALIAISNICFGLYCFALSPCLHYMSAVSFMGECVFSAHIHFHLQSQYTRVRQLGGKGEKRDPGIQWRF